MKQRAAFLDRDGTVIVERGWVRSPSDVRLIAGAGTAIRMLNDAGFLVVLVTNQSGVARGFYSEADLAAIHDDLGRRLRRFGARIDAIYYCPHHPAEGLGRHRRRCNCRKPARGMINQAVADLNIGLRGSFIIGDDLRDLALSRGSPLRPVLVRTGKGKQREPEARRTYRGRLMVADRLLDAVEEILT